MFERKLYRSDMLRCALCADAPCSEACGKLNVAAMLRSIWFDDEKVAASRFEGANPCAGCAAPCEAGCVRAREVPIRTLMMRLYDEVRPELEILTPQDGDRLRTELCGIPLENPFLLSSSVVGSTYDMCARAFEAGWAGVAFKTICSFDIHEASPRFSALAGDNGSIIGFKNIEQLSDHSVSENMEIFRRLKEKYPTKFILASIMGQNEEEWEELARLCEENGADAVELNFSCPNMAEGGLRRHRRGARPRIGLRQRDDGHTGAGHGRFSEVPPGDAASAAADAASPALTAVTRRSGCRRSADRC